ncbi:glycine--tRNA ligase subunit beta [Halanaerobacter jeridensis]|uniref:Glycine--tRNA ligase beta subunit n=1 Tax=Halanaerobacter jeridensis TaxID=706427 RepID=A0A939BQF5_9FIRM|nr:glycine--tRNA ligase subunit beta [Halanaerobacter jeridensis]MBM7556254.1 glycyl-tRNA synthetase beta chain [Halanaerobacter jeridensis]
MSKDLLLEIGTEEIPAGFMLPAFEQLEELAQELFEQKRIEIADVLATGTPRRLTLYIEDVAEEQEDLEKEIRGPAKNIAFDDNGEATKAGEGFARGQGLTPDELEIRDTENGEYVFACTTEEGQATKELLPDLLEEIIFKLDFPKSMRWGSQDMRFARPIKWLLSLYGTETIEFSVAEVEASNWSRGHRFLSEGQIEIEQPEAYFDLLETEGVIVDHSRRRKMIVEQIEEIERDKDVTVAIADDLLTEVNFLVEYPTALCGSFAEEFLQLPEEVLITSMREHQRYFPVRDQEGKLKNLFITVRNGNEGHLDIVREGNEKVLQARLADAKFFYEEDQQAPLENKVEQLKDIIFQEDLGTIYEKVERMIDLAQEFASDLEYTADEIEQAQRAAKLAKADLVTEMVNEFSKLQGVMGREYALIDGEDEAVAEAIFEHYLPRYADDKLPESKIGRVASLADKIDNIVACFSVGLIPTGSQDPYALRRQGLAVVKIITDAELDITLEQLINSALDLLEDNDKLTRSRNEIKEDLMDFFALRLEKLLEDNEIRYDVINAVLATDFSDVNDTILRADAVMKFRNEEGFAELITAFERASNLADKGKKEEVKPELFTDDSEKKLYAEYQDLKSKIADLIAKQDYLTALKQVATLKEAIDNFFNSVMVMAEDEEIKENRLGLLKSVTNLLSKIADLTEIVID